MLPSNSQPMLASKHDAARKRGSLKSDGPRSCQCYCGKCGRWLNAATGLFSVVLSLGLIAYAASSSRFGSQSFLIGQPSHLSAIFGELAPRDPDVLLLCRKDDQVKVFQR
jgi:hypothetical protein